MADLLPSQVPLSFGLFDQIEHEDRPERVVLRGIFQLVALVPHAEERMIVPRSRN
jgi:hypothetical protein